MITILPHTYSTQETGYYCGPASAQIVLDALGIAATEGDLAAEMLTDHDGTDWIGQVTAALRRRSGRDYRTREIPNDPPTVEQRDQLWRDVVDSIDAGAGLVVNIVAPPGN
ncbi:C39 family peptidase, partial [Nocardia sp. NPDC057455]|uniref:C39 family peptidase n=1 Tax=Nocardia sp. NPDC057455 TaxID=3346138 RepID=UPI00366C8721